MKQISIIISLLCLFLSVGFNAQNTKKRNLDDYGIMMITPDSLLSKEMLKTKHQLGYYFFSFTDVVDGKLVFKPDNSDEDYKNLPKQYIKHFLQNIDEINNCKDSIVINLFLDSFPVMKRNVLAKLPKK